MQATFAVTGRSGTNRTVLVATDPNWAEIVTAIATAVGAIGLLSAIGAVIYGAREVREAERSRHAAMAADFLCRWDEPELVEARHLAGEYATPEELRTAFVQFIETNSFSAYVLYRELDFFEQLAAAEQIGAFDFELIRLLLGARLVERWEMWKPSLDAMGGERYPMFDALVRRMRTELAAR
jgi:hypothetical protein